MKFFNFLLYFCSLISLNLLQLWMLVAWRLHLHRYVPLNVFSPRCSFIYGLYYVRNTFLCTDFITLNDMPEKLKQCGFRMRHGLVNKILQHIFWVNCFWILNVFMTKSCWIRDSSVRCKSLHALQNDAFKQR